MKDETLELIDLVCAGNDEAKNFCFRYLNVVHLADDIVDGDIDKKELPKYSSILIDLLNHPFYLKNSITLYPLLKMAYLNWEHSNRLMDSSDNIDNKIGDITRVCGNDILTAVCLLTQGWEKAVELGVRLKRLSYKTHHNEKGDAI